MTGGDYISSFPKDICKVLQKFWKEVLFPELFVHHWKTRMWCRLASHHLYKHQRNATVVASCCGDVFPRKRLWNGPVLNTVKFQRKSVSLLPDNCCWMFTFRDNDPNRTAKTTLEWFKRKLLNILELSSQSQVLIPSESLWCVSKTASRSHPTWRTLEQVCLEECSRFQWLHVPDFY